VKKTPLGSPGNTRPDYQQLLTGIELLLWLDSSEEKEPSPTLESRVSVALATPASVSRFGGLSLGESTHLVDEVSPWARVKERLPARGRAFLRAEQGRFTLPVWVDHVGSAGTRYATGNLEDVSLSLSPTTDRLPQISPE
jgi:CRISPR-associated protein Cas5t